MPFAAPWASAAPLLSSHMDVVDVSRPALERRPFTLREREGRLVGRGMADMKGFLACSLLAAEARPRWAVCRCGLRSRTDEEIGCRGAALLAPAVAAMSPLPTRVIVGEPTGMRRATAHKGKLALGCASGDGSSQRAGAARPERRGGRRAADRGLDERAAGLCRPSR